MATTLAEVEGYLGARGLQFRRDEANGSILVPFGFKEAGFERVLIVVRLQENGEFVEVIAPNLFHYPDGPNKLPLMQTLLHISWETKMLQWEYDPTDGEIRATIEFPLEDAPLTQRQFYRVLDAMLQFITVYGPRVRTVLETGSDPGRRPAEPPADELARSFLEYLSGRRGDGGGDEPPDAL